MKNIVSVILLFCSTIAPGQSAVREQWDPEILEKANTAAAFSYYSDEEKKVVFFMNLARLDGNLFAETLLDAYVASNGTENSSYLRSLYRDLRKVKGLPLLIPEEDLTGIAQGHATESGRTGHVGHKGFEKRFEPFMGAPYSNVGENASYGHASAIDIVITLLIDEGVKNVGHRVNILNPEFNSVGVVIREHKRYRVNCVIDFGKQDRSNLNELPF
ncbi:MAG: CAP domain-containing protein [Bacteroidales bacterium]|nr:CAP domain-containing protein [Bacteroidales bacterium]MDT8431038.1 CAP domain-containing protein [Bacteroidales bacterium]